MEKWPLPGNEDAVNAYMALCTQVNIDFQLGPYVAAILELDPETLAKVDIIWRVVTEKKKDATGDKPPNKGGRKR